MLPQQVHNGRKSTMIINSIPEGCFRRQLAEINILHGLPQYGNLGGPASFSSGTVYKETSPPHRYTCVYIHIVYRLPPCCRLVFFVYFYIKYRCWADLVGGSELAVQLSSRVHVPQTDLLGFVFCVFRASPLFVLS